MTTIVTRMERGSGANPNTWLQGEQGSHKAKAATANVATSRELAGLLLKNGARVRITSRIKSSERVDSKNQPVRNWSTLVWRTNRRVRKVIKSNTVLIRPKVIMKSRIKPIF